MLQAIKDKNQQALHNWLANGGSVTFEQFAALPKSEQDDLINWLYSRPIAIPELIVNDKKYFLAHASHPLFY